MPQRLLEICVDSLDLALAAVRGGADRLELCGPLFDGGVTPSAGFVAAARRMIDLPLAMLVRPHAGSFTPSDAEFEVMRQDILYARNIGIEIIVLGLLHSDQTIDIERTRSWSNLRGLWRSRFIAPSMFLLICRNRSRLSYRPERHVS